GLRRAFAGALRQVPERGGGRTGGPWQKVRGKQAPSLVVKRQEQDAGEDSARGCDPGSGVRSRPIEPGSVQSTDAESSAIESRNIESSSIEFAAGQFCSDCSNSGSSTSDRSA